MSEQFVLIPAQPGHIDKINQGIKSLQGINQEQWVNNLKQTIKENLCYAGVIGDEVVGVGGISRIWDGVGEAFIAINANHLHKPKLIYKTVKKMLKQFIGSGKYHRIQATCRVDVPQAANFLEHLGFKAESVLERFTPDGVDCFMYAILIGDK